MSQVPEALPAVLHGAYVRSVVGEEQWAKIAAATTQDHLPNWENIGPLQRKHWEAVARTAVEYITEEKIDDDQPGT